LAIPGPDQVVRYAAAARWVLSPEGDDAVVREIDENDIVALRSTLGACVGRVLTDFWSKPIALRVPGQARGLLDWWRVGQSAEACGNMRAALSATVNYLNEREQFGQTISTFQAVQDRLAECAVALEGATWLTRFAAAKLTPTAESAEAATIAVRSARHLAYELHQLTGAIGLTTEYPLHVWTTQLFAQTLEMGGHNGFALQVARTRWMPAETANV
jgi:hypothetical protein